MSFVRSHTFLQKDQSLSPSQADGQTVPQSAYTASYRVCILLSSPYEDSADKDKGVYLQESTEGGQLGSACRTIFRCQRRGSRRTMELPVCCSKGRGLPTLPAVPGAHGDMDHSAEHDHPCCSLRCLHLLTHSMTHRYRWKDRYTDFPPVEILVLFLFLTSHPPLNFMLSRSLFHVNCTSLFFITH
ncbi:hypothetical protein AAFF_G00042710 [Aldrovandia affinis]|uniref:Uncharacterized protein n=1 Tax=Aldrovandia affinis TaxID=143900 RepID=A0AAD7R2P8_9TELE|nr:hypothetical protein AAFF_G00042710 [Aldrovandia affinis]